MFQNKNYQQQTLDTLRSYLENARYTDPKTAFDEALALSGRPSVNYTPVNGLEDVPYICLRIPTGGGKTFISAQAITISAQSYMEVNHPLVLLLVPSNKIREQTYETFTMPGHPNREILWNAFNGQIRVIDIADFTQLRPQDFRTKTCIVIATIQTLRVQSKNKDARKVYAHNEHLEPHFARVPENFPGLHRIEDGPDQGKIKYSFANLLAVHKPLVLVDEAHNASTNLSFDVLRDVSPSCILEYTATPANNSNVLHYVSAAELKAEEMIKLPIVLTEHQTWRQAVQDAVLTREKLHQMAQLDPDYIRPIVLFQAEDKGQEVTYRVLEKFLTDECNIDRERIAIATGNQRELDGVNLLDPSNQVDFVITVEALKEGWDCPFAYVFCSVANVRSARAVEQILGRVLRMPYAKKRTQADLNKAYAHVSSSSWPQAVGHLRDKLVRMGFEDQEADRYILPQQPSLPGITDQPILELRYSSAPDLSSLNMFEQNQVKVSEGVEGYVVEIGGAISSELEKKITKSLPKDERQAIHNTIANYQNRHRPLSPSEKGAAFTVPQLCLWVDGEMELAEQEWFLGDSWWTPLDYPCQLSEAEFAIYEHADSYEVDVLGKRIITRFLGQQSALDFGDSPTTMTELELVRRMSNNLQQQDLRHEVLIEYLRRTVDFLIKQRNIPLAHLFRARFSLEKAFHKKIKEYREQAFNDGYQATLFGPQAAVQTSFDYSFEFNLEDYPSRWNYAGSYQFGKHYYPIVGELKPSGEEFECAQALDRQFLVEHWVRNLEKREEFSFRLPLADGWFYPDFVAQLKDERILVVEYKGAHLIEHEQQKKNIGERYAEMSDDKALFWWAVKQDEQGRDVYQQLEQLLSK